jgi:hypothetical protein
MNFSLKFPIFGRNKPRKSIADEFIKLFEEYSYQPFNGAYLREKDPMVVVKLYDPIDSVSWYLTRYNQEDKIAYGYITTEDHFAHFSISELEEDNENIEMEIVKKRLSECLN